MRLIKLSVGLQSSEGLPGAGGSTPRFSPCRVTNHPSWPRSEGVPKTQTSSFKTRQTRSVGCPVRVTVAVGKEALDPCRHSNRDAHDMPVDFL